MQNRILAALLILLGWLGVAAAQQFPLTLPTNTVYGRLAIGSGPGQAIPFDTLRTRLLGTTLVNIGPANYYLPACGGVDDTAAIQAVENTLTAAGGGTIHFPAGLCRVTGLTKFSLTRWQGAGVGTTFIVLKSGTTANAVIAGSSAYALFGTGSVSGITSFGISDFTVNCSADSGGHADGIGIYGWVFTIERVEITNCTGNGMRTEFGIPGLVAHGGPWASVRDVWVYNNDLAGIKWAGPPDSVIDGANVYGNTGPGIWTIGNGTGIKIANSHNSSLLARQNQYGFRLDTPGNMIINSTAEGATIAQVWIRNSSNSIVGGRYYYNNAIPNTATGIRLGEAAVANVGSIRIDTQIDNAQGGAIWFDFDSGINNDIRVRGYNSTSAGTLGYLGSYNGSSAKIDLQILGDLAVTNPSIQWDYTKQTAGAGLTGGTFWWKNGISGDNDVTLYAGPTPLTQAGYQKWVNASSRWSWGVNGTEYMRLSSAGIDLVGGATLNGNDLTTNSVDNAQLRQGTALSIIGNATNATANVADIAAASDFQVMRRSGTAIAFGSVNLASTNAVTGALPVGNGGTGLTGAAWTAYTPTLSCGTGTLTTSSAAGSWEQTGKTVRFTATATITTNGTCATRLEVSLPATSLASTHQALSGFDAGTASILTAGIFQTLSTTKAMLFTAGGGYPGADAKTLVVSGQYQAN